MHGMFEIEHSHPINPIDPINHGSDDIDDDALEEARRELNAQMQAAGAPPATREFVYACPLSAIPVDGRRGRAIPLLSKEGAVGGYGEEVALFNLNGEVFATSNLCPHEMSPVLAAGFIDREKKTVACPLHGWIYHIPTGRLLGTAG